MSLDHEAKRLSDDLFNDDPEIIRLRNSYEAAQKRQALVNCGPRERNEIFSKVTDGLVHIRYGRGNASEARLLAALDDIVAGDVNFTRAMDVHYQLEDVAALAQILQLLDQVKQTAIPAPLVERVEREVVNARNRLGSALLERKKAYLNEHPDALAA